MKSFRRLLWFFLLAPALLHAQTGGELRTALVIGCDYSGTGIQLPSPAKDARAIASKLESLGFAVTIRINPDLAEFEKVSNEFSSDLKLRKGVGLFYFSGHGAQVDERNYLIPHNASLSFREDLRTRAYAAQDIVTRMEAAGSRLNLLFLDACRTNELPSSSSKNLTKGLAGMEAAAGMLISFASARNSPAIDTGLGSAYTNALVAHISTPGLSVLDMLTRVSAQVKRETRGLQVPFMEVGLDGTFAFAPAISASFAATHSLSTHPFLSAGRNSLTGSNLFPNSILSGSQPSTSAVPSRGLSSFLNSTPPANLSPVTGASIRPYTGTFGNPSAGLDPSLLSSSIAARAFGLSSSSGNGPSPFKIGDANPATAPVPPLNSIFRAYVPAASNSTNPALR